jgi:hypothetical protein
VAGSLLRVASLLVLCGLVLPGALAAGEATDQPGVKAPGERVEELDEVAILGKSWRRLQREMTAAEDRFYRRFNELNTRDAFDIHCRMEKETGTLVPKRQCRIQFLAEAQALDAQEFYRGLFNGWGVNAPLAALTPKWLQNRDEYLRTARALLEQHPDLMALAMEWQRLQRQYERVLQPRGE